MNMPLIIHKATYSIGSCILNVCLIFKINFCRWSEILTVVQELQPESQSRNTNYSNTERMHFDLACILVWFKLRDWNITNMNGFLKLTLIFQLISNSCILIKFSLSSNSLKHTIETELHKKLRRDRFKLIQ